jgi:DNA-binding transcriptional MerR regulator
MAAGGAAPAGAETQGGAGPGRTIKSSTAFRTISEVADELDVAQHVLRFWESKFPQVRPLKRGGGRRYYRPEDVELLRQIRSLLYDEGYTIKGAQKLLRARRTRPSEEPEPGPRQPLAEAAAPPRLTAPELRRRLKPLLADLIDLRDRLRHAAGRGLLSP